MESLNFVYNRDILLSVKRAKLNGIFINAKPILLISIMDAYSLGIITANRIMISPHLIDLYQNNFTIYQPNIKQTPFYIPFFHLSSDGFWQFKLNNGYSIPNQNKTPSLKWQKEAVQYAYFSDSLYLSIYNNSDRERLKDAIIQRFFSK